MKVAARRGASVWGTARGVRHACTAPARRTIRATRVAQSMRGALAMLVAFGTASLACPAHADELTGTLKKIHDDGVVVLGVREASIPFSYFDGKQTVGYSQTIALQIVDEIKKTLGMPQLKVHEITVTSSNRTPMLLNNQIDLECGSTTHTVERENVAAFSNSCSSSPRTLAFSASDQALGNSLRAKSTRSRTTWADAGRRCSNAALTA